MFSAWLSLSISLLAIPCIRCNGNCMVPVRNPGALFGNGDTEIPIFKSKHSNGYEECNSLCCETKACNVVLFYQNKSTNCLTLACNTLKNCDIDGGDDALVFVDGEYFNNNDNNAIEKDVNISGQFYSSFGYKSRSNVTNFENNSNISNNGQLTPVPYQFPSISTISNASDLLPLPRLPSSLTVPLVNSQEVFVPNLSDSLDLSSSYPETIESIDFSPTIIISSREINYASIDIIDVSSVIYFEDMLESSAKLSAALGVSEDMVFYSNPVLSSMDVSRVNADYASVFLQETQSLGKLIPSMEDSSRRTDGVSAVMFATDLPIQATASSVFQGQRSSTAEVIDSTEENGGSYPSPMNENISLAMYNASEISDFWTSEATSDGLSNPMTAGLVSVLAIGCVFMLGVIAVLSKRVYDGYKKRHYNRLEDYLINGMYN